MPKAIWNNIVIAEAPDNAVEIVEGNVYFPLAAVHQEYLQPSDKLRNAIGKVPPVITTWSSMAKRIAMQRGRIVSPSTPPEKLQTTSHSGAASKLKADCSHRIVCIILICLNENRPGRCEHVSIVIFWRRTSGGTDEGVSYDSFILKFHDKGSMPMHFVSRVYTVFYSSHNPVFYVTYRG